jgi:hypothetical protein
MCTVSVVPHARGVRLVANRDERRTRARALPPGVHAAGRGRAIFPIDPEGGGTWVGCNSAGLAAALLNANPTAADDRRGPLRSRGLIVCALLQCSSIAEALTSFESLEPRTYAAFRVVAVQGPTVAVVTSDGHSVLRWRTGKLERPLMLTSSSLGDSLVGPPRRRLFDRFVRRGARGWLEGQARFHNHQWAVRPEISVRMERADALTVSRTSVDIRADGFELHYEAPVNAGEVDERPC